MKVHWFHRTENRKFDKPRPAQCYELTCAPSATLDDILLQGYREGLPAGSARGGCFELQTDKGIWSRPDGKRLYPSRPRAGQLAVFKTWAQLEAEDAVCSATNS